MDFILVLQVACALFRSQLPGVSTYMLLITSASQAMSIIFQSQRKKIGILLENTVRSFFPIPAVENPAGNPWEPQPTIKRCRPVSAPGLIVARDEVMDFVWEKSKVKTGQNDKDVNITGKFLEDLWRSLEWFILILWGTLLCHNVLW